MANQIQGIQGTQSQSSQSTQSTQVSQVVAIQEQYQRHMTVNTERKNSEGVQSTNTISMDEVQQAVNELNAKIERQSVQVNFDVDDDTGRIVVKVKDVETGDILRQIPSEEMLEFARNASRGVGVTLDQQF
jgi:flagellar protein FlaG